jgi:hypothetical protein
MKKRLKKILVFLIIGFVITVISYSYSILRDSTNPNGNIKLAKWSVSLDQSGVENHISVIPGDATSTADYILNVESLSEVDIIYTVVINNVPTGVSVDFDNSGTFTPEVNNSVIFSDIGTIRYSDVSHTKTHTLTFKADSTSSFVSDEEIDVNVIARQVLPN